MAGDNGCAKVYQPLFLSLQMWTRKNIIFKLVPTGSQEVISPRKPPKGAPDFLKVLRLGRLYHARKKTQKKQTPTNEKPSWRNDFRILLRHFFLIKPLNKNHPWVRGIPFDLVEWWASALDNACLGRSVKQRGCVVRTGLSNFQFVIREQLLRGFEVRFFEELFC